MELDSPALLVLEDGSIFEGRSWGAKGAAFGEIVFTTGMTGYQETLTDPSYHRQIVLMTAPHVGNTGINQEDDESARIWVAGFIARDPARRASNWRATHGLEDELISQNIVGLRDVDTRQITRHIRSAGSMKAGIFSGDALGGLGSRFAAADLVERVRSEPSIHESDLAAEVSTKDPYVVEPVGDVIGDVVAIDLGIKSMTTERLAQRGLRVHVLPSSATMADIEAIGPDAVFFSNGPGDPQRSEAAVSLLREVLERGIPYFGICFGNQLLGRALGLGTYKLPFGHRGVNQPVKDLATGKVEITSQNHGFAVKAQPGEVIDTEFGRVTVSHVGLNDQVVEGLACLDIPAFSVQYHPEAASGPHDASYLFDRFADMIAKEN